MFKMPREDGSREFCWIVYNKSLARYAPGYNMGVRFVFEHSGDWGMGVRVGMGMGMGMGGV